jgi:hypothetical protein
MFYRRSPPATPETKLRMAPSSSSASTSALDAASLDGGGSLQQDDEDPAAWRRRRIVMPGSTALHQVHPRQPSPFLSLSYPSGVVVAQNPKARSWLFSFAPFFVTATQRHHWRLGGLAALVPAYMLLFINLLIVTPGLPFGPPG